jgi:hypothetical protein
MVNLFWSDSQHSATILGSILLRGMIKRKEQAQMILVSFVLASWPHFFA